jgi:uncharacterized protein (TIGR02145 family)
MKREITLFLFFLMMLGTGLWGQVADIDGNQYPTVIIGQQEWMMENLRTSRLGDGTPIPQITSNSAWFGADGLAMCWYNNDSATHHWPYGRLYNGYVAEAPGICPAGWMMPTPTDWDLMINNLGGATVAGGKLKDTGFVYWEPPNTGATNSSGFTALPSGFRSHLDGTFNYKGQRAGWFVLQPGGGLSFRFVSWSMESSGSGPVTTSMGLGIRCFRYTVSSGEVQKITPEINLYPIPASDRVYLDLGMIPEQTTSIRINDISGRTVLLTTLNHQINTLNISHLPAGIYMTEVLTNNTITFRKKIIVSP